jgi:hypothetical protein
MLPSAPSRETVLTCIPVPYAAAAAAAADGAEFLKMFRTVYEAVSIFIS